MSRNNTEDALDGLYRNTRSASFDKTTEKVSHIESPLSTSMTNPSVRKCRTVKQPSKIKNKTDEDNLKQSTCQKGDIRTFFSCTTSSDILERRLCGAHEQE